MTFLLDTNVLSEIGKSKPNDRVVGWLHEVDEDRIFLSVASIAEIRRGLCLLPAGGRRDRLSAWLDGDLAERFAGRIIPIGPAVANRWGELMAQSREGGVALSVMDAFFAATALAHALILVTRNVKDFLPFGVDVLDPWREV